MFILIIIVILNQTESYYGFCVVGLMKTINTVKLKVVFSLGKLR